MEKSGRLGGGTWSTAIGIGFALAAVAVVLGGSLRNRSASTHHSLAPLGMRLPTLSLTRLGGQLDGQTVELRQYIGARPALLFVVSLEDCASCANVPFELVVAKKQTPGLERLVIASGAPAERFRPYIEKMGKLEAPVFVDESHALLDSLHVTAEHATLVTDSTGRVLFVDTRSTSQAAQRPVGLLLHDLLDVLTAR